MIRMLPEALVTSVRTFGVDDWAKHKGQNDGTILVDLEQGQIVDLLSDRTAETLTAWLKAHPAIKIVTRDRSGTYADAINRGAPAPAHPPHHPHPHPAPASTAPSPHHPPPAPTPAPSSSRKNKT